MSKRMLAALAIAALGLSTAPAGVASAAPRWAPADTATIHPGTMMYTKGAQCTANFVYRDKAGHVFVGYAAHCAGLGEATDTDGCRAKSLPLGTPVTFTQGGSVADEGTRLATGRLVYSSWRTMRRLGTTDASTCAYNDLALVKVKPRDIAKVNPSIPFWGGPTGIDTDGTAAGDQVYTFGNSSLRGGVEVLSPHTGVSLGDDPATDGWSHPLYTVSPGVPGDSGSAFLSEDGKAIGVLSTLGLAPLPASNNIGDLGKELAFARAHSGLTGLRLVKGTEEFSAR
ncbi:hypothetical protein ASC77_11775 [Nocardioides sp. Root1257]|uniref:trypsin-like peptidase domain-containing protein n=1 Tax=unclassified Nocardioides TaxID=2615069 RepID=UPI0006F7BA18|nr:MULTISPECIES: trypsin-like peptidase domain-containing protein [unclassified Nocardioides]KQW49349.1 hypothetical protein ASC77_11775 [Nocardioides sp. Root1257]KRC48523.1 hypothetical protein ASE24_11780 [Nocardioides sp. Root224]